MAATAKQLETDFPSVKNDRTRRIGPVSGSLMIPALHQSLYTDRPRSPAR